MSSSTLTEDVIIHPRSIYSAMSLICVIEFPRFNETKNKAPVNAFYNVGLSTLRDKDVKPMQR